MDRKIIHVDMDAFYASVEQRDNPQLKGKPVAVGGSPKGRGVVAAASYEARKYGVRSAMSSRRAKELCPSLTFVKARFDVYREVSKQIRKIFHEYSDLVEPLSLDEAFIDVTENKKSIDSASVIAKSIRSKIKNKTNLTASAGVGPNKFLAKLASDWNKPNSLTVISPLKVDEFLEDLPVRKIPGVGKVTEERLFKKGILSTKDIRSKSEEEMKALLGRNGTWFWNLAHGVDERKVSAVRTRKSIGKERTFGHDLIDLAEIESIIRDLLAKVSELLDKHELAARTITLKVTYANFERITRAISFEEPQTKFDESVPELIGKTFLGEEPARLLGISLSNLIGRNELEISRQIEGKSGNEQLELFC